MHVATRHRRDMTKNVERDVKLEQTNTLKLYVMLPTTPLQLSDAGAGVVFGQKLDRPGLSPSGTAWGHFRVH